MPSANIDRYKPVFPVIAWLVFAAALLCSQGLIVKLFLHDSFVLFDGMWRTSLGDIPHIDFHTPVGQAYFWPFLLLGRLGDHDALTVIHAHVLIGAALAAAMAAMLPRRLTAAELTVSAIVILAMAVAPRDVDRGGITDFSWLAPYNRWSWGMWMLAVQAMLIPPSRERPWLDGVLLGLLAGFMAYTKLTFFAGAAAIALLAIVTGRLPRRTALVAIGTLVALVIGVELIWHNNLAYWADLRMAMVAGGEGHYLPRTRKLLIVLILSSGYWVALPLLFKLACPGWPFQLWVDFWWRPMGIAAAVLLAGIAVSVQNFPDFEFAHLVLAMLVAWQLIRIEMISVERSMPELASLRSRISTLFLLATLGWALIGSGKDVASIFAHAVHSRDGSACRIPALAGTQSRDLMVPADQRAGLPPDTPVTCAKASPASALPDEMGDKPIFYLRKLERTMALIRQHGRPGEVILTLDFSNPYPFLLRTKAPHGALLWMDLGRNYGNLAHPPAEPMLRSAHLVVQTKLQAPEDNYHAGHAWALYGPAVSRYFHIVGENETARLWRRNGF